MHQRGWRAGVIACDMVVEVGCVVLGSQVGDGMVGLNDECWMVGLKVVGESGGCCGAGSTSSSSSEPVTDSSESSSVSSRISNGWCAAF